MSKHEVIICVTQGIFWIGFFCGYISQKRKAP